MDLVDVKGVQLARAILDRPIPDIAALVDDDIFSCRKIKLLIDSATRPILRGPG